MVTIAPAASSPAIPAASAHREAVKPGARLWTLSFDISLGTPSYAATDADGNVLWAYPLSGPAQLPTGIVSSDEFDVLAGKVSRKGTLVWARALGLPSHEVGALAVDAKGGLVLAGTFTMVRGRGQDRGGFVLRLFPDGRLHWKTAFDGSVVPNSVGVDARGEVTLSGGMQETVDFGGGPVTSPYPRNSTSYSWFLARFAADGKHVWSEKTDFNRSPAHAFAPDGATVIASDAPAPMTLFGATLDAGPRLVRVDSGGRVVSAQPLSIRANKLAAAGDRVCLLAWDPPIAGYLAHSSSRLALQCFDVRGALLFDRTLSGKNVSVHDLTLDPSGYVSVTGSTNGEAPFDAFTLSGGQFIAGFAADGKVRFAAQAPCPGSFGLGPDAVLFGWCNDERGRARRDGSTVILTRYAP